MKTVLKFDAGGRGFRRVVYFTVTVAFILLGFGIYFLASLWRPR